MDNFPIHLNQNAQPFAQNYNFMLISFTKSTDLTHTSNLSSYHTSNYDLFVPNLLISI